MQNLPRKNMGTILIALSALFLFNPDIAVFDLLPDMIGYILMSAGLSSLSYLNHHFEESAKRFHRLIALGAARIIFVPVLFGLVSVNDRPTTMLLGGFVFGVLELIMLLPAYKHLFEGFIYSGSRGGVGDSVFRPTGMHRLWSRLIKRKSEFDQEYTAISVTESTAFLTAVFAVLKVTLNVLPEFTVLTETAYDMTNLYSYVWIFRVIAVLLGAIVGVIWLLVALRYFLSVYRDKPFLEYLQTRYMQDIFPNKELFVARRYKLGSFFLLLGMMLSIDLPMDGINVLPDILCATCLIAGVLALRQYLLGWKSSVVVLSAYAFVSLLDTLWQIHYFKAEGFSAEAALGGAEATQAFAVMVVLSVISSLLFVLSIAGVLARLHEIIRAHTGYEASGTDYQTSGRLDAMHKELMRGLVPVIVLGVLCAVGYVTYTGMLPYAGMGGEWYRVLASVMWVVNLLLGVVFVVVFAEKNNDITEQINNRYLFAGNRSADTQAE